jgi:hypothetical protein
LGFSILKEVIQAPHPEAIQTVSAQNGGFKKGFLWVFQTQKILFSFQLSFRNLSLFHLI